MSKLKPNPKKRPLKPSNDLTIGHPSEKDEPTKKKKSTNTKPKKNLRKEEADFMVADTKNTTHSSKAKQVEDRRTAKREEVQRAKEAARIVREQENDVKLKEYHELYVQKLNSFDPHKDMDEDGRYKYPMKRTKISYLYVCAQELSDYARVGHPVSVLARVFGISPDTLSSKPWCDIIYNARQRARTVILQVIYDHAKKGSSKHIQQFFDLAEKFDKLDLAEKPVHITIDWGTQQ
jgi:hypothetical protein